MNASDTADTSPNTSSEKFDVEAFFEADQPTEETCYAVKLQSKYQLIKNAQEGHLHNEIELMSKMDHPLILKM